MDFPALAGNERLKQQLSQREEGRGLSHAYLIAGPKGSGRHTLATELSAAMVCTAPAGQRPCHLGNSLPHSVQKKMVFAFIGVTRFRWSAGQVGAHKHHGQLGLIVLLLQQLILPRVGQKSALHQDGTAIDVVH